MLVVEGSKGASVESQAPSHAPGVERDVVEPSEAGGVRDTAALDLRAVPMFDSRLR